MEKNTEYWEAARDEAIKGCAEVWPAIQGAKRHLHRLELIHGKCELKRLEAERHLVEVVKVGKKHEALNIIDIIAKLSPKQRAKLVKVFSKAAEIMGEQDHV